MTGRTHATIMVQGIRRAGIRVQVLSQASVGANEPIPRVSKKFTTAPTIADLAARPESAFGQGRSDQDADVGKGGDGEKDQQNCEHASLPRWFATVTLATPIDGMGPNRCRASPG